MNQNTIDFMYGLRDLLKKHDAELDVGEKLKGRGICIDVVFGANGYVELPPSIDHKEVQKWLDTPEGSE